MTEGLIQTSLKDFLQYENKVYKMCIIHQSSDGMRCDCTGTGHVGATCGIYFPYGPQTNVNEEKVTSEGWTECHSESMTVRQNSANLDAIMRKCSKSQLMMGCRKVGSSTITLFAAAPNRRGVESHWRQWANNLWVEMV